LRQSQHFEPGRQSARSSGNYQDNRPTLAFPDLQEEREYKSERQIYLRDLEEARKPRETIPEDLERESRPMMRSKSTKDLQLRTRLQQDPSPRRRGTTSFTNTDMMERNKTLQDNKYSDNNESESDNGGGNTSDSSGDYPQEEVQASNTKKTPHKLWRRDLALVGEKRWVKIEKYYSWPEYYNALMEYQKTKEYAYWVKLQNWLVEHKIPKSKWEQEYLKRWRKVGDGPRPALIETAEIPLTSQEIAEEVKQRQGKARGTQRDPVEILDHKQDQWTLDPKDSRASGLHTPKTVDTTVATPRGSKTGVVTKLKNTEAVPVMPAKGAPMTTKKREVKKTVTDRPLLTSLPENQAKRKARKVITEELKATDGEYIRIEQENKIMLEKIRENIKAMINLKDTLLEFQAQLSNAMVTEKICVEFEEAMDNILYKRVVKVLRVLTTARNTCVIVMEEKTGATGTTAPSSATVAMAPTQPTQPTTVSKDIRIETVNDTTRT
jgi:hypothetical protein